MSHDETGHIAHRSDAAMEPTRTVEGTNGSATHITSPSLAMHVTDPDGELTLFGDDPAIAGTGDEPAMRSTRSSPETCSLAAVDYGSYMYVSTDGTNGNRIRPNGRYCGDFVECVSYLFHRGFDVVTETTTKGSFGLRGREHEITRLHDRFPGRHVWEIPTHAVLNWVRTRGISYDSVVDHDIAANVIWQIATTRGMKPWRPRDAAEQRLVHDPVRPHVTGFIQLRSDGYPRTDVHRQITPFLPVYSDVGADERRIIYTKTNGNIDYAIDRASALVYSLSEPLSAGRRGWEKVIGATAYGHPSAYRQVLSVGKPRRDYRPGERFPGMSFQAALRAMRHLRSMILAEHPELVGLELWTL